MKADRYSYLAQSYEIQFMCYRCKMTYKTSEAEEEA